jgi:hypothetical protein
LILFGLSTKKTNKDYEVEFTEAKETIKPEPVPPQRDL